jgi:hypothetical protein
MPLNMSTAVAWITPEEAIDRVYARSKKMRIIDESLHIRTTLGDPLKVWDTNGERFVYIRKLDWLKQSLAITTTESCSVLRIKHRWFLMKRDELGIIPKPERRGSVPHKPGVGVKKNYYTVDDLIEISRIAGPNASGEDDLRHMFNRGSVTYVKNYEGELVPIWDASI